MSDEEVLARAPSASRPGIFALSSVRLWLPAVAVVAATYSAAIRLGYMRGFGATWEDTNLGGWDLLIPCLVGGVAALWFLALIWSVWLSVTRGVHRPFHFSGALLLVIAALVVLQYWFVKVSWLTGDATWMLSTTGEVLIYVAAVAALASIFTYVARESQSVGEGPAFRWAFRYGALALAVAIAVAYFAKPAKWALGVALPVALLIVLYIKVATWERGERAVVPSQAPRSIRVAILVFVVALGYVASVWLTWNRPSHDPFVLRGGLVWAVLLALGYARTYPRVRKQFRFVAEEFRAVAMVGGAAILSATVIGAWHFGSLKAEDAKTAFAREVAKQSDSTANALYGLTSQPICLSIAVATSANIPYDVGPVLLVGQGSQTYLTWDPGDGLRRWPIGVYLTHSVSDDAKHC